ncbi:hypothetical protein GCM10010387_62270 [Streptomyces inusitatus]|uniref:Uncharacterized protein n=1 Tax=Streptomyces inusitatus TaxID=68221 RepID=A0A918QNY9_9ACTN|nr:hypothetical protein [Streptomyces inusitatus]GGZ60053.1 hypothetical protein GCM10010387_62270 [Streptomyces inusitatus]
MPDPLSLQEYLVKRCERCDRVGFTLHDGREFLGWVTEVTDSLVLLDWALGPMDLNPPAEQDLLDESGEWLSLDAILPGSASHYDRGSRTWVPRPC